MTLPFALRYPFDPTGTSPANLVVNEEHTLPARNIRAVAPLHGGYYTESLVVVDASNNQTLTKGVDYDVAEFYQMASSRTGKEVCCVILITNAAVSNQVLITYQAVGGEFSTSAEVIEQLLEALNLDNRPVTWPSILNRPSEFTPSQHLHDVGDIFGFEYHVHALERIVRALEIGDDRQHEALLAYFDAKFAEGGFITTADVETLIGSAITTHSNAADPHTVYRKKSDLTEDVQTITASSPTTAIDLSLGKSVFIVTIAADTSFQFINPPEGFLSFTLITKNDATPGRTISFPAGTDWAGGLLPPRTTAANAKDYWFFVRESSSTDWVGSLSVADAK